MASCPLIGAIDQGTSNSRFLVFSSKNGEVLTYHQIETQPIYPKEGWAEQDPGKMLDSVYECIRICVKNLSLLNIDSTNIQAIGITNHRESVVAWDKVTGKPLYNAIIWHDIRTVSTVHELLAKVPQNNKDYLRSQCGLPITTYFSAVKIRWLLDNCPSVKEAVSEKRCLFGTIDSWLIWNLSGGDRHVTDVTNASRTMLMNLKTLDWDPTLCEFFEIPPWTLPEIRSSSEVYTLVAHGPLKNVPIAGILGDQQSALVGQKCFHQGDAKNTYGTGCFLLYNTGSEMVGSSEGLLTTVAYQMGASAPAVYALEGSVATAGSCIRWLRDNLGIIQKSSEVESLASEVDDTHGCYFVPAFSGLFCPYWQNDARGVICGLTAFTNKAHIARAALEAVCFQTRELLEAMKRDSRIELASLRVDGGMTVNNLLMQLQADLLGIPVVRPAMTETTALGVAMAAGHAVGVWDLADTTVKVPCDTFKPSISQTDRDLRYKKWKKAIVRSQHWEDDTEESHPGGSSFHKVTPLGIFALISLSLYILADRT